MTDATDKLAQALRAVCKDYRALRTQVGYLDSSKILSLQVADQALAAHDSAQADYVMVPREPTLAMIEAGNQFTNRDDWGTRRHEGLSSIWKAMLSAAPTKETP